VSGPLSPIDLERLIDGLKEEYGVPKTSRKYGKPYQAVTIAKRVSFLTMLVQAIKDTGRTEDYFSNSIRNQIAEELAPKGGDYSDYKKYTKDDLRTAIARVYKENNVKVTPPKEVTPEPKPDLPPFKSDMPPISDDIDPEMEKLLGYTDE
jgi:hypothetical protein